ncbi:MAG: cbb3-type cytochrome c oxidase subunit I [Chloroflexia bacterium]
MVSLHAHTLLLTGLGSLLFAVIYALLPMLTRLAVRSRLLVNVHLWLWLAGSVAMAYGLGMAGSRGMLRRTIYTGAELARYQPYLRVGVIGAVVMALGFLAFLLNLVGTLGWKNLLDLLRPERGRANLRVEGPASW